MSRTLYKLASFAKPEYIKEAKLYRNLKNMSPMQIEKLEKKRLRTLLIHANKYSAYYNNLFKENYIDLNAKDIYKEYKKIPFLTKEIIRENQNQILSVHEAKGRYANFSSGSTGEPIKIYQDDYYKNKVRATSNFFDTMANTKPGDKTMVLWGADKEIDKYESSLKVRIMSKIKRLKYLNCWKLDDLIMEKYVEEINNFKPIHILGYAEALNEISKYIIENNIKVNTPKSIISSAGMLDLKMRENIEKAFNRKVFNRYGSREVGGIAIECELHDGLHISTFSNYLEIVDENGIEASPGEIGEIVLTSLNNFSFPLIRYRVGDFGKEKNGVCPCGNPFPLLSTLEGRTSDYLVTSNKLKIRIPTSIFSQIPEIEKYQIIQNELRKINISILINSKEANDSESLEILKEKIKVVVEEFSENSFDVEVNFTKFIKPTSSGKHRYIINNILS
ncbi:hypothetical protein BBH88_07255 [Planococcus antarcticus DSM 14505]|uniref:Capsule biosynthesis protein CapK n=1 Tax=Planococcus antarcticus DSM 14505 TaxID=1185653 RepID=A0ABM6D3E7_9BACL|nr:phenylacetate--CoA ligase family protein [Planococcus antarcticus]ANU10114.1 hypothetical protein BBH88_07255 [Planococcus antarcticus DSM 14505]